jgi:sialidase-1
MVAPCDFTDENTRHSHVIYSDDGGDTWNIGGIADEKTDESTVVELSDGTLCLNMRSYRGLHQRAVSFSSDHGLKWTSAKDDPALIEPICQGSIFRAGYDKVSKRDIVVFSNPASDKRDHMSVRVSMDGCKTWSAPRAIWEGPAAYSDLVVTTERRIGCLYERGEKSAYEKITMVMFPLEWITQVSR